MDSLHGALFRNPLRSNYNSDILATVRDGAVYDGRSSYRSDIRFTIDGPLTLGEFVAVWYSVMYGR